MVYLVNTTVPRELSRGLYQEDGDAHGIQGGVPRPIASCLAVEPAAAGAAGFSAVQTVTPGCRLGRGFRRWLWVFAPKTPTYISESLSRKRGWAMASVFVLCRVRSSTTSEYRPPTRRSVSRRSSPDLMSPISERSASRPLT